MPADLTAARAALAAFTEAGQRIAADRLTGKRKAAPMNRVLPNAATHLRAALAEVDRLTAALDTARAEGRREGLREAAGVCHKIEREYYYDSPEGFGADRCADRIEALADGEVPRG